MAQTHGNVADNKTCKEIIWGVKGACPLTHAPFRVLVCYHHTAYHPNAGHCQRTRAETALTGIYRWQTSLMKFLQLQLSLLDDMFQMLFYYHVQKEQRILYSFRFRIGQQENTFFYGSYRAVAGRRKNYPSF